MQWYVEVTDVKGSLVLGRRCPLSVYQSAEIKLNAHANASRRAAKTLAAASSRVFENSVNRNAFTVHHSQTQHNENS